VTSGQVTISGDTVTIDPSPDFDGETGYYVLINSGAFEDLSGNDYAGISDKTTWNFTTPGAGPTLDPISNVSVAEDPGEQEINLSGITTGGNASLPLGITAFSSNTNLLLHPTVQYSSPDATGTLKYTPLLNQHGTSTVTVTVEDGGADNDLNTTADNSTTSHIFEITVDPRNDPPVTTTLTYRPSEDKKLSVAKEAGLPTGTSDVDSNSLTFHVIAGPAYGSLDLHGDGSFDYTPNTNFNRIDSFTYRANDGQDDSNTSTVTLSIINSVSPWYNSVNPKDVNDDHSITNDDAHIIIDDINKDGIRQLPSEAAEGSITAWIDVNRDGHISPVDVLIIADHMNILAAAGNGEGESLLEFATFSLSTDHSTSLPDTARGENRNQLRTSSASTTLAPLLDNSPYGQHLAHSQETGMPVRPIHEDLNSDGDEVFEQLDWLDDELEETLDQILPGN
jgi:hypothetical protein